MDDTRSSWERYQDKAITPERHKPIAETPPPQHIQELYEILGAGDFIHKLMGLQNGDIIAAFEKMGIRVCIKSRHMAGRDGQPLGGRVHKMLDKIDEDAYYYDVCIHPDQSTYSKFIAFCHEAAHLFLWELEEGKALVESLSQDDLELFCDYFGDMFALHLNEDMLTFPS